MRIPFGFDNFTRRYRARKHRPFKFTASHDLDVLARKRGKSARIGRRNRPNQTDDTIAMVCAKCKTVWTTRVKQGMKGAELLMVNGKTTELIGTHACKGCNSTITVTGHAKGNITELKHSCGACGDDSAFCCATKPGSGATKGMEKQKK